MNDLIKGIDFSGSTYQIEVFDTEKEISFYPFLQFDRTDKLIDSFCDCEKGNKSCRHIKSAYEAIFDGYNIPWHKRFELSIFKKLAVLFFDRVDKERAFHVRKRGSYFLEKAPYRVDLEIYDDPIIEKIETLLFHRNFPTPETSIKFSNLTAEQLQYWREGRPDFQVRFELSFWADIMKYFFWLEEKGKGKLLFKEVEGEFPKECTFLIEDNIEITFHFEAKDLEELIDALGTLDSNLKQLPGGERTLLAIHYDPEKKEMQLVHKERSIEPINGMVLGKWLYLPKTGFIAYQRNSLLERDRITKEEISYFLTSYGNIAKKFLDCPLLPLRHPLKYYLFFDKKGSLHIQAYLFQKEDLTKEGTELFGEWVYVKEKGFVHIEKGVFSSFSFVISRNKVASFVSDHRLWLNGQKEFSTHLASLESGLIYEVDDEGTLHFMNEPTLEMEEGSFDFGEWVYYKGKGFFAKRKSKVGIHVRPQVAVKAQLVERFIQENGEELESISAFFSPEQPLLKRLLTITVKSHSTLIVKPIYTLKPHLQERAHRFYGEYLYIKDEGFCLLEKEFCLPEEFAVERVIHREELAHFILEQLPKLQKYIDSMPIELHQPRKCELELHSLVRTTTGELKAQLFYITEYGRINGTELLEAMARGQRFYFSSAGLFDLKKDSFSWLREKMGRTSEEFFLLSTLDFIRLDAREGLLLPTGSTPQDEITLRLAEDLRTFSVESGFNLKGLKSQLRLYQETGVKWLWFLYINGLSGLLCDDMGLGKTHQAMALMAAVSNGSAPKKPLFLVVCPTSVIYHWQDKLEAFLPHLKVQMFHGIKRKLKRVTSGGVIVTTYGILRMQKELFASLDIDVAIFDEIQLAKNAKSGIHKAIKEVKARMNLGLTGTPIENNLSELKALFDLTLPGYLPKDQAFRSQYIYPIERNNDEEKKAQLVKLIKPFTLRRRKSEVLQELPSKSEDKSYCDLSEEQAALYRGLLEERKRSLIHALEDPVEKVPYMHIFSLLSSLKQICNHPALYHKDVANYKSYQSSKWDLCVELLSEALESGQKVVIFSQYLLMLDILEAYLVENKISYAQIRGETVERRRELERFQKDETCKVFIGSLQAAGLGIDLTAASVVIMYDRWWNLARENQAIDRVHRIGQKWGVQVFKLITKETIEEKIDLMIMKKGRLMEEIVTVDDQATLKSLSRAELLELLQ